MGLSLSKLKKTRPITVDFEDAGKLKLSYNPAGYTPEVIDALGSAEKSHEQVNAMVKLLANVIEKWDLTDDEKNPLPPTEEVMVGMPLEVLNKIAESVMADQSPNEPSASDSGSF